AELGGTFLDATIAAADAVGDALDLELDLDAGVVEGAVGRTTSATAHRQALIDRVGRWGTARSDLGPGQSALLRPGEPIVEILREQSDWDEASQVCVLRVPEGLLAMTAVVRVDLIVLADPHTAIGTWMAAEHQLSRGARAERTDADAPLAMAALQRR